MKVRLLCIYENGLPADPGLPLDPRVAIRMQRGASLVITFQIYDRSGQPHKLLAGTPKITFTVRRRTIDKQYVMRKAGVITDANNGVGTITIVPLDTQDPAFEPGIYAFDVWLAQSGGNDAVLPISPYILEPSVASPT